jgi:hypothetical protein
MPEVRGGIINEQIMNKLHKQLDCMLLVGLGLSKSSASLVMDEIERLRSEVENLTGLLKATRRYRLGHEIPMEWFIKRDKAIGNPGVSKPL